MLQQVKGLFGLRINSEESSLLQLDQGIQLCFGRMYGMAIF
jgi:hypothetical protein